MKMAETQYLNPAFCNICCRRDRNTCNSGLKFDMTTKVNPSWGKYGHTIHVWYCPTLWLWLNIWHRIRIWPKSKWPLFCLNVSSHNLQNYDHLSFASMALYNTIKINLLIVKFLSLLQKNTCSWPIIPTLYKSQPQKSSQAFLLVIMYLVVQRNP